MPNYAKELNDLIKTLDEQNPPRLLLHSCCAPCSSAVLEFLSRYFLITVDYYNPNIFPAEEYQKRAAEQKRLIDEMPAVHPITFTAQPYDPESFLQVSRGLENCPEGGERCERCFELRLRQAAVMAKNSGYDFFCTTLSISPLKNAAKLNEIGQRLALEHKIKYLPSDFKKANGYKRSTELSHQYGLYRQDFCGCVFSKIERQKQLAVQRKDEENGLQP